MKDHYNLDFNAFIFYSTRGSAFLTCTQGFLHVKSKQILEYHPDMLKEHLRGTDHTGFMYPRLEAFNFLWIAMASFINRNFEIMSFLNSNLSYKE